MSADKSCRALGMRVMSRGDVRLSPSVGQSLCLLFSLLSLPPSACVDLPVCCWSWRLYGGGDWNAAFIGLVSQSRSPRVSGIGSVARAALWYVVFCVCPPSGGCLRSTRNTAACVCGGGGGASPAIQRRRASGLCFSTNARWSEFPPVRPLLRKNAVDREAVGRAVGMLQQCDLCLILGTNLTETPLEIFEAMQNVGKRGGPIVVCTPEGVAVVCAL